MSFHWERDRRGRRCGALMALGPLGLAISRLADVAWGVLRQPAGMWMGTAVGAEIELNLGHWAFNLLWD